MTPDDISDTPHDVVRQDAAEPGEWLSLAVAATRLQRHPRTIQRMVTAGELTKRTLRGGKVELWVPLSLVPPDAASDDEVAPDDSLATSHDSHDMSLAVMGQQMAMIERLNELAAQQTAPLLAELSASRQRIEELAAENGRLKAELERHTTSHDTPPMPWWRRWFGP